MPLKRTEIDSERTFYRISTLPFADEKIGSTAVLEAFKRKIWCGLGPILAYGLDRYVFASTEWTPDLLC